MGDEITSIFSTHGALKRVTKDEIAALEAQGIRVEYIPAKAICQVKAGSARKKVRVVACGNHCSGNRTREQRQSLYAGGIDSTSLRCQLRHCALHASDPEPWVAGSLDIRTAFLTAPLEIPNKVLILKPPSLLVRCGLVDPQELWQATGAIYGLEESPAAWGKFRDSRLPKLEVQYEGVQYRLKQCASDQNLWMLVSHSDSNDAPSNPKVPPKVHAVLGVYVDDLLATGPKGLIQALFAAVQGEWATSNPQFSDEEGFVFCGLEIIQRNGQLHLSQERYITNLLSRYPQVQGTASSPYPKEPKDLRNEVPQVSLDRLRHGQALVGELLWVSTRSRPDLCYGVSRLGQWLSRQTEFAIAAAEQMLRYLRATCHYKIVYGPCDVGLNVEEPLVAARSPDLLECFADASYGPGTDRSQTGIVMMWANAPVAWLSLRQATTSLSTAEAELGASLDAMVLGAGLKPVMQELRQRPQRCLLYSDNIGACSLMQAPHNAWRTRHLRLKAAWFFERLELSDWAVWHVPGQNMLGDLCTKSLLGCRVKELLKLMHIQMEPSPDDGGECTEKRLASLNEARLRNTTSGDADSGSGGVAYGLCAGSGGDGQGSRLLETAVKVVALACQLQGAQSKVVITIEDEAATATTTMRGVGLVVGTLAVVGVLALLFALRRLGVGRRPEEPEGSEEPRARAMSVEELEHEGPEDQTVRATGETQGDPSEWSLVSEVAGPSSWRQGVEASTEDCRVPKITPKKAYG